MVSLMAMFELYRAKPSPGKFSWFRPVLYLGELFNHMINRMEAHIVVNANLEPWIVECTCQKGAKRFGARTPKPTMVAMIAITQTALAENVVNMI